jgi:hypothetical protein
VTYALIGAGTAASETRRVTAVGFSVAGNSITLAAVASGAILATVSGPTLSGGSSTRQASGTVTFGGTPEPGDSVTVTIDGQPLTYSLMVDPDNNLIDTPATVAAGISTMINADPALNRYLEAIWTAMMPNQVLLRSKLGILSIDQPLDSHTMQARASRTSICLSPMPPSERFSRAQYPPRLLPLATLRPAGLLQPVHDRLSNDAVQDYQATEVRENDYEHQERTNRVSKYEISGSCVDNYHQADRLVRAARYEMREGNFFCTLSSTGSGTAPRGGRRNLRDAQQYAWPAQSDAPHRGAAHRAGSPGDADRKALCR